MVMARGKVKGELIWNSGTQEGEKYACLEKS
jgi:hypothetical protein